MGQLSQKYVNILRKPLKLRLLNFIEPMHVLQEVCMYEYCIMYCVYLTILVNGHHQCKDK